MHRIVVLFRQLLRRESGIALIEFALVLPFLLLILYGAIELGRFMLIAQKVDKASYALADITNQYPPATKDRSGGEISVAQMNDVVFEQFERLMEPYDAGTNGSVTITSLRKESGVVHIKWQVSGGGSYSGTGTESAISGMNPSTVNASGAALKDRTATPDPSIAADVAGMDDDENMVVSEIFYHYEPILTGVLGNMKIPFTFGEILLVRRSYTNPRQGDLACLPETFVYSDCS